MLLLQIITKWEALPDAFAIVHPMHPEFDYPCPNLCGAGVAIRFRKRY